ncbi:MAG: (d)CMP kinase [Sphingomonadales bacterium]
MIIAIDGPAAAGKGTLARALASKLGFAYLDTGALYRAVALGVKYEGGNLNDPILAKKIALNLNKTLLEDHNLRLEETGESASIVAAMPEVRAALLTFQRNFVKNIPEGKKGAILDGRDIGTVVVPDADLKFFVTASPETRAGRRFKDMIARGVDVNFEYILKEVKDRDARDSNRKTSPLKKAENALLLDTTKLDIDGVLQIALKAYQSLS